MLRLALVPVDGLPACCHPLLMRLDLFALDCGACTDPALRVRVAVPPRGLS